jgi:parvulin-like peptidyl-prolyl isomerase
MPRYDRIRTAHALGALATAAVIAFTAPTAQAEAMPIPEGAICSVYDQHVLQADFDQLITGARQQYWDNRRAFPSAGTPEWVSLRDEAVGYLVQRHLIGRTAAAAGIVIADAEVDKQLAALILTSFEGRRAYFEKELARTGYTEQRVRDDLRDQLVSEALTNLVTKDVPRATAPQARREYNKRPGKYRKPKSRVVGHLLVPTRDRARALRSALDGRPYSAFAAAVKRLAADKSSATQGERMTISIGQTIPAFQRAAFSLRRGQMSAVVRTEFGFHLIYAIGDVRPARQLSFSKVVREIRAELDNQARGARMTEWSATMRADAAPNVACRPEYPWTPSVVGQG